MHRSVRCLVLGLAAFAVTSHGQISDNVSTRSVTTDSRAITATSNATTVPTTPVASVSATPGNATCESRTANYITHKLPQQCLRTDRVATNATRRSDTTESSTVDDANADVVQSTTPSSVTTSSDVEVLTDAASPSPSTWVWIGAQSTDAASASANPGEIAVLTSPGNSELTTESDSPLDNANFLSFEEWKRQNSAKSGQAGGHGNGQLPGPGINNALDSLGEEGEIEIDFSGFGGGASSPRSQQAAYRTAEGAGSAASAAPESYTPRSKDAGKTCKERTNYASFDCAATVLKTNPECKSASSVLVENKDSYTLNTCSATNKFFIVELCNDILIDTVVLANYEFFSSIFRHFRVSVSDRYPVKIDKWKDLGTFEARNTREVQAFLIQHPQIWARYLRIEFLTHYGSEYYCPVSLLRVHGTTMLEEIRPQDDFAPSEGTDEEASPEPEAVAAPLVSQEPLSSTDEYAKPTAQSITSVKEEIVEPISTSAAGCEPGASTGPTLGANNDGIPALSSSPTTAYGHNASGPLILNTGATCAFNATSTTSGSAPTSLKESSRVTDSTATEQPIHTSDTTPSAIGSSNTTVRINTGNNSTVGPPLFNGGSAPIVENGTAQTNVTSTTMATSLAATAKGDATKYTESDAKTAASSTTQSRATGATASTATPPQPSTQESFFKSIHKRLQQLEANSTLSLQYIEEQSRILRDAFQKVEKRQISATTSFLTHLNETVMAELRGFRQAYDQLWQSTVIELDGQREQHQREMVAVSSRLTLVADELVWQKRMSIVQSTLILLCLGLVLFARGGQHFEVPLMQQMMNSKSQTSLSKVHAHEWESPPNSPSPEGRSPVSLFRKKLAWRSITEPSGGFDSGTDSRPGTHDGIDVTLEPPTPERSGILRSPSSQSTDCGVDGEEMEDGNEAQDGTATPRVNGEGGRLDLPPDLIRDGVNVT